MMKKKIAGFIFIFAFALLGRSMLINAQVAEDFFAYLPIVFSDESSGTATPTPMATATATPTESSGTATPTPTATPTSATTTNAFSVADTGQAACYDDNGAEITCPAEGEAFYGQDAQFSSNAFDFTDNGDDTVTDNVTSLMWQQTPANSTYSWQEAVDACEALQLADYDDWRIPSLKELFSISNFSQGWPYIDLTYFNIIDRINVDKDEQYWANNYYAGVTVEGGSDAAFGVNHATGHIKAYPAQVGGPMGKYVRCVRGDDYGANQLLGNGDSTITDEATGLMWMQDDSGEGMDWESALAWAQQKNAENYLGYSDWRLPNVKELQSMVDYSRAPDATDSANEGPAIDPLFNVSTITNEAGNSDYPYYWSSTSARFQAGGDFYYAWYVALGRAVNGEGLDFHGAGAVRFDTKVEGGPAGEDPERIYNYVRLVRGGDVTNTSTSTPTPTATSTTTPTAIPTSTATPTVTATPSDVGGLDTTLFFDGALAEEISIQDCTLSDGTETTCYEITIAGSPANHGVGPFCPETTSDTAEAGGIWFDGNAVYDLTGAFILGLADLYNDSNWKLYDDDGNVNVTDTQEAFEAAARPDVDPAYQNHCVEGRIEWLENSEPVQTTVLIPTTPVDGASATQANGNLGITLNGVIIAHSAPVEDILSAYTIAAFDDCGGHINPTDGYHLHGARGCSEVGEAVDGETPIFAYALDGYPIHSPLDAADEAAAGLDECNGHTTEADGYHYHAAAVEENAILSCFTGVTASATVPGGGGPPPGGGGPPPGGRAPQGGPPQE